MALSVRARKILDPDGPHHHDKVAIAFGGEKRVR
jgi:hypothetical protein